jgi:hypothetical protein
MRVLVAQRRTLETRRFLDDLENAGVAATRVLRYRGLINPLALHALANAPTTATTNTTLDTELRALAKKTCRWTALHLSEFAAPPLHLRDPRP